MPAPVASGWSGRRVGLAPTGKAPPCHGARGKRWFLILATIDASVRGKRSLAGMICAGINDGDLKEKGPIFPRLVLVAASPRFAMLGQNFALILFNTRNA